MPEWVQSRTSSVSKLNEFMASVGKGCEQLILDDAPCAVLHLSCELSCRHVPQRLGSSPSILTCLSARKCQVLQLLYWKKATFEYNLTGKKHRLEYPRCLKDRNSTVSKQNGLNKLPFTSVTQVTLIEVPNVEWTSFTS